uniref:Uncharacterized protein n=1 Tax=Chryseobacterium endophyticum TaxID=1854762 RepID=A0AAU6WLA8_9FLAO
MVEIIKPKWALRLSSVAVPRIANFHLLEYNISKAHSETVELEHGFSIRKLPGRIRLIASHTRSQAPSYEEGLQAISKGDAFLLDVIRGKEEHKMYGGKRSVSDSMSNSSLLPISDFSAGQGGMTENMLPGLLRRSTEILLQGFL